MDVLDQIAAEVAAEMDGMTDGAGAEAPDPNTPPPTADDVMFYGVVADVAALASMNTEVNPVAAAAVCLSWLSACFGRDVAFWIGNTAHHCRIFTLQTGRTGRGRKGDSMALVHRVRTQVAALDARLASQHHGGGLSTKEGMIVKIHDGFKAGREEHPAIEDKRLWVTESEFVNVLHQGKRDGNTLSAALRDAWDGVSIQPQIKGTKIWATNPHIAVHGCITPSELRECLAEREISNGFLNRFLLIQAERSRIVPLPEPAPEEMVGVLAERCAEIIKFALGDYPASKDSRRMRFSPEGEKEWERAYRRELTKAESTDRLTALMERAAPYALRLSMLFALSDMQLTIEPKHIHAALAWVRYARESARYVFATALEMAQAEATREHARAILAFLAPRSAGASRTEIYRECFQGHVTADEIDAAITRLLSESPPLLSVRVEPRADGRKGGAGRKVYVRI
ncbi:MAG: DUF3987 domain-containing protein [Methylococcus sp.]